MDMMPFRTAFLTFSLVTLKNLLTELFSFTLSVLSRQPFFEIKVRHTFKKIMTLTYFFIRTTNVGNDVTVFLLIPNPLNKALNTGATEQKHDEGYQCRKVIQNLSPQTPIANVLSLRES